MKIAITILGLLFIILSISIIISDDNVIKIYIGFCLLILFTAAFSYKNFKYIFQFIIGLYTFIYFFYMFYKIVIFFK